MVSTYRVNIDELTPDFIEGIKKVYQHQEVEIIIREVEDETEYLMKSPENHRRLLESIENIKQRKNLVTMKLEDL